MPTYVIKFSIDFCGDYGTAEIVADEEPDSHELWEMALDHFQPEAEVIEVIDDEEDDCKLCEDYREQGGPPHEPSPRCESGQRPHCSCDRCF